MAAWGDIDEVQEELQGALEAFDWTEVSKIGARLAERIVTTAEPFPDGKAAPLLYSLRRKRRFDEMKQLAEALLRTPLGRDGARVRRQYAQALIDSNALTLAKGLLQELVDDEDTPIDERYEAVGLLGRLHKQLYVNARSPGNPRQQENLRASARWYLKGSAEAPKQRLWHAINVVAVVSRAKRDGLAFAGFPDEAELARTILQAPHDASDPWSAAIRMEAHVALREWKAAGDEVVRYVGDPNPNLDAFELAGTLRQLQEVWGLSSDDKNEAALLDALRSAVALRISGEVSLSPGDVGAQRQANFDAERKLPLPWWDLGRARCNSVARIESQSGIKIGSGFLVDPVAMFGRDEGIGGPLLLTNWHVISKDGTFPGSIPNTTAVAHFQATGQKVPVGEIVAYNQALDACLVALAAAPAPALACCPLRPPPTVTYEQGRRVYVIGYPSAGDLSFSIHDSFWLGMDDTRFHYRTPTEPGSSGSPVFDDRDWNVVALHRAGGTHVARLSGVGTYEANEGVSIAAIQKAVLANRMG